MLLVITETSQFYSTIVHIFIVFLVMHDNGSSERCNIELCERVKKCGQLEGIVPGFN
jgi:hypothetical protein